MRQQPCVSLLSVLFLIHQQQYHFRRQVHAADTRALQLAFQDCNSIPSSNNNSHQRPIEGDPSPETAKIMRSAWHCHGRNQRELVQNLMEANIIRHSQVAQVMSLVDRKYYLPKLSSLFGGDASAALYPYVDAPQSIGHGQTISAPHMHAHVLEEIVPHLLPVTDDETDSPTAGNDESSKMEPVKILDVGCGSGYLTACFGRLVHTSPPLTPTSILGRPGKVFGVDIYPELVARSKQNIQSGPDKELLEAGTIQLMIANGWKGLPNEAPFDAIHVGAAAEELPKALAMQLKVGGVLIVPVGPQGEAQVLYKVERVKQQQHDVNDAREEPDGAFDPSDYRIKQLLGVQYVPLVKEL
ncbi:hypothetical protein MPSEU_000334700 [Mayamaea pseudoterrestris]|nr:hypothetical protein MPSEU_000334700 [Mayamaea pseudoterrestris]